MIAPVRVERAAAALRRRQHVAPVARQHARRRAVVGAEDHRLHAAREHRHPGAAGAHRGRQGRQRRAVRRQRRQQRFPRRQRARQQAGQSAAPHEALQAARLVEVQAGGGGAQHARAPEQHAEVQPAERAPGGAAGALALDLGLGRLDQAPVGHAGRAYGLARPAVEAEREVLDRRVAEADPALGQ